MDDLGVSVLPTIQYYRQGRLLWEQAGSAGMEQELGEGVREWGTWCANVVWEATRMSMHVFAPLVSASIAVVQQRVLASVGVWPGPCPICLNSLGMWGTPLWDHRWHMRVFSCRNVMCISLVSCVMLALQELCIEAWCRLLHPVIFSRGLCLRAHDEPWLEWSAQDGDGAHEQLQ